MHDLIILGAGPAGLTAGIYAARGGIDAVIVESKAVGGQAALTAEIENYPGFETVNGFELVSRMQAQCERLGVTFVYDNPVNVSLDGDVKRVETARLLPRQTRRRGGRRQHRRRGRAVS